MTRGDQKAGVVWVKNDTRGDSAMLQVCGWCNMWVRGEGVGEREGGGEGGREKKTSDAEQVQPCRVV